MTSCGSGVTAAVITLALETLGHSANKLYDGSWTEWGGRSDTPVVTGKMSMDSVAETAGADPGHRDLPGDEGAAGQLCASADEPAVALLKTRNMPLHFYRYLMDRVGRKWHWVNVLRLSDEELAAKIHRPDRDIRVLYLDGAPAGFFDLKPHLPEETELAYFGMMEHATGQGLGRWFLGAAIEAAWATGPADRACRPARSTIRRRCRSTRSSASRRSGRSARRCSR